MDAVDRRILDRLRLDTRESYGAVGEVVGLSASAVKRRVDRLVADGVIRRFTVDVAPDADAPAVEAYVEVFCRGLVAPRELRRLLERIPQVVEADTVTGEADAVVRLRSRDVASLEQALEALRRAGNIERTRSAVLLTHLLDRR